MQDEQNTKMELILITLPNEEDMLRKLMEVKCFENVQNKLYPLILKNAGRKKYPQGVVMMLTLAINDATKDFPVLIFNMTMLLMPKFLESLITDEVRLKDAMDMYKEIVKKSKNT